MPFTNKIIITAKISFRLNERRFVLCNQNFLTQTGKTISNREGCVCVGGGGLHIQNFTKLYENVVWETIRRSSGCENCHLKLIDNFIIIVLFLFSIIYFDNDCII